MWMFGVVLILAGAYLLYFEAGLSRWVSIGVLTAGFLLFIGLAVMSYAATSPPDTPAVQARGADRNIVVDNRATTVKRDDRRD